MSKAYEAAGVNIEAGYEGVKRMKKHVQSTMRPEVIGGLGGFGGLFDMSQLNLKEPVLVSGTDGVGTKLLIAQQAGRHDTIGIDAVAMCVNDISAQGASPLFFLDYLALGKNEPALVEQIVSGVAEGCREAGCALIGGETAEMPDLYKEDEYDVAGFVVGAAEKTAVWQQAGEGDVLLGLASSGIHSNGFSLVRKIVASAGLSWEDEAPFEPGKTTGESLLTPTRIYAKALEGLTGTDYIRAAAHITGGGLVENIPRMLEKGAGADIDLEALPKQPVFPWLQEEGRLTEADMLETFNLGVGFVLAVEEEKAEAVSEILRKNGEKPFVLGKVTGREGLQFKGELSR
ncbi:phosphoribosylformylglycinamidine cyclo-ligase [Alkalicoccus halolimnae]|uniref:Phosphoribosylformylglycinamidine cyclo-ligase n=1 Tax=Alkalicoccus halolimnae TaxID=1667239 RepID=A0A5C7F9I4_9BACI|nr:phosphoribosylformylglycinamidine cyclo-ligase [Alkalicoccus halolimnae]TXF86048.1 phosphoribosylformylglycinamidine cyclo-ligase [Alkalicoccus halolimnae]